MHPLAHPATWIQVAIYAVAVPLIYLGDLAGRFAEWLGTKPWAL